MANTGSGTGKANDQISHKAFARFILKPSGKPLYISAAVFLDAAATPRKLQKLDRLRKSKWGMII